jgi:hypothetical protein
MKTLTEQLACARRELKMRQNVYPRFHHMTDEKKAHEIECMQEIIHTLEACEAAFLSPSP